MITFKIDCERIDEAVSAAAEKNCELQFDREKKIAVYPLRVCKVDDDKWEYHPDESKLPIGYVYEVTVIPQTGSESYKLVAFANESELHNITEEYWNKDNEDVDFKRCDRCGKGIERKKIYVIRKIDADSREATDEVIQVGGACAKEFDCETALKKLLKTEHKFFDFVKESDLLFDEGFGGNREDREGGYYYGDLEDVAGKIVHYIQKNGFIGSREAEELAYYDCGDAGFYKNYTTAGKIEYYFRENIQHLLEAVEDKSVWLDRAINFLLKKQEEKYSTVNRNALAVLGNRAQLHFGYITWVFAALIREDQKKAQEAKLANADNSTLIEKQRYTFQLEIVSAKEKFDDYGSYVGITAIDDRYGKVWLRGGQWYNPTELGKGSRFKIDASVGGKKDDIVFLKRPTKFELIGNDLTGKTN